MATDHPRALIRMGVAAGLKAADTMAGSMVFADRIEPVNDGWTAVIFVHTPEETIEPKDSWVSPEPDNPGRLTREMTLAVAGMIQMVSKTMPIDRLLDQLAYQIESYMDADPTLGGLAAKSVLNRTNITLNPGGASAIAMVQLVYNVTYYTQTITAAPAPAVPVTEVFVGVAPEIGPDHVADYVEVVGP